MKKTLNYLGMAVAIALAFTACNRKEEDTSANRAGEKHYVTFNLGKDVDTKTMVVEGTTTATYKWCEGDDQYLHVYENGSEGTIEEFTLSSDNTKATLTVSFTGGSAPYTYKAMYATEISSSNKNPKIQAEQHPTATSFDPAADILFSKEIKSETAATTLSFTMGRPVTVNKMILTGLEAGEVISAVDLTFDRTIYGYVSPNTDGGYKVTNGGSKLSLKYETNTSAVGLVPSNGKFPVYFVAAPVENAAIASVVVTTDKNVYTKAGYAEEGNPFYGKTISFAIGNFTPFLMNMEGYDSPIEDDVDYTKVNDEGMIQAGGEYLFVGPKNDKDLCAAGAYSSSYYSAVDVTATDDVITISSEQVMVFTLEASETAGQFYIKDSEGYYLYWNSGNSVSRATTKGDNAYLWTISLEDGIVNVKTTARKLQYNAGSPRFACYTSAQKAITLYVNESTLVELADPGLAFSAESATGEYGKESSFDAPTLINPHNLSITWSSSNEEVATIDADGSNLKFVGDGTTTITAASAKTSVYSAGSASYELTVSGTPANKGETADNPFTASEAVTFIQGLSTKPTDKEYYVSGIVTRLANNGQFEATHGNATFFISDDGKTTSQEFEAYRVLYLGNRAWQEGDQLIGVGDEVIVCGKLTTYGSGANLVYETLANANYNGYLVSLEKASYFTAELSANSIDYTGGNLTLTIGADVPWSASINNGGKLKIGTASEAASVSGTADTEVTVIIPQKTAGGTYTISFSTTSDKVTAPEALVITQTAQGDAPKGSESNPYTVAEAIAAIDAAGSSSLTEKYVKGIITSTKSYSAQNNYITLFMSDDGLSTSAQLQAYHAVASSETEYGVADFVVLTGTLKKYGDSTYEFDAGATKVAQVHAPSFSPDGGNFTTSSVTVSLTADDGAQIRYTLDDSDPTPTTGTVYSAPITLTQTKTIKAIAVKDGMVTGVVSKTYSLVSAYAVTFTQPTQAGCSFTVSVGGEDITSGTMVPQNTVVTLKATAGSNYTFAGWTVTGATVSSANTVTATFTMGASAVSISATFKENEAGTATASLTGDNMAAMSNAGTGYGTAKSVTVGSFTWTTNGYQTKDLKNMIQLRVRTNSNGVSYIQLPTFPGYIQSVSMKVTTASAPSYSSSDYLSTATIAIQSGTTKDEEFLASGTPTANAIELDLSSKNVKTGYIVVSGYGARFWEITVVYNN